jgi:L-ascorbate metabolism protein UlaG (beta-lactamase superfamily)
LTHIHYIGHATVAVDIGSLRVLTDPLLRNRLLFLQRHSPSPVAAMLEERLPDLVLLSHLHYDHVDLPSLRQLPRHTLLVAPRGSGRYLQRNTGHEVHEMAAGDTLTMADVQICALPAEHSRAFSAPRPMTTCLSYTICNHMTVYFAGDTGLFDGMDEVGSAFDLDVALLPV